MLLFTMSAGVGSGSGRGTVRESPEASKARRAQEVKDGAEWWRASARTDPSVRAQLTAAPAAIASAAVQAGVRPAVLQEIGMAHGAPYASSLADAVRALGVSRVAGMAGLDPDALLELAGVSRELAVACRLMSAPSCGAPSASSCGCGCSAKKVEQFGAPFDTGPLGPLNGDPPDEEDDQGSDDGDPGGDLEVVDPGDVVVKPAPNLPADGFPASPPFRPGNIDFPGQRYMIASGDTLAGLARLLLGGPGRWREIWTLNKFTYASPDKIPVGGWIKLPPEAIAAAQALLKNKNQPKAPASPGAPGSVPGVPDPGDPGKLGVATPWRTAAWVAAGVAGVAAVGGLGYAVLR